MTRKELHEVAIIARNMIQNIWIPDPSTTKRCQLYCKCRGVVLGDRTELAVFHSNNPAFFNRAFN